MNNYMILTVSAIVGNESFVRNAVAAFCAALNPTVDEINDIKTAVSEAVTNSIVHGYPNKEGEIHVTTSLSNNCVHITVSDDGIGIDDIVSARKPFYTTRSEDERSGMGFTVMESFMDSLDVENVASGGLKVTMTKHIGVGEKVA